MRQQEKQLPRRVNKEDLQEAFIRGGFLRSYTLRMKITGREFQDKSKKLPPSTTSSIPVMTPPRRNSKSRILSGEAIHMSAKGISEFSDSVEGDRNSQL